MQVIHSTSRRYPIHSILAEAVDRRHLSVDEIVMPIEKKKKRKCGPPLQHPHFFHDSLNSFSHSLKNNESGRSGGKEHGARYDSSLKFSWNRCCTFFPSSVQSCLVNLGTMCRLCNFPPETQDWSACYWCSQNSKA